MARVAAQSQQLLSEFLKRQTERFGQEPLDPLNLAGAYFSLLKHMAADPGHMFTAQIALWRDYLNLMQRTGERALGRTVEPFVVPAMGDRRFRDKDWQENQVFDFIKQSYLVTSNWLQKTVAGVQGMDAKEQARASFYAKQFVDAIAPSNFVLTNPEVLRETLRSNGDNLVKGLDNLLSDLDRGQGELSIRQTTDNFVVGRDVATTPGKVIFRNELFELLQYSPTTETAFETPLLIFPALDQQILHSRSAAQEFLRQMGGRARLHRVRGLLGQSRSFARREETSKTTCARASSPRSTRWRRRRASARSMPSAIASPARCSRRPSPISRRAANIKDRIKSATFLAAQVDFSQAGDL